MSQQSNISRDFPCLAGVDAGVQRLKNMSKVTQLEELELAIDGAATATQVFLILKHILLSVVYTAFV